MISGKKINGSNELYDALKSDICEGRIEERLPSIMQLCRLYNVSHCTVKKVLDRLRNHKYIEGHKGKCVLVNEAAVGNPLFQKNIVFYLHINTMGNPFYLKVLSGVRRLLQTSNSIIHFVNSSQQLCELGLKPDVIVLSEISDENEIKELQLICGREKVIKLNDSQQTYNTVGTNNYDGGFQAAEYLYRMGHRNVGLISRYLYAVDGFFANRFRGFQAFAAERKDMKVFNAEVDMEIERRPAIFNAMEDLLSQSKVSAIFAFSDTLALGVYSYCNEHMIKIPEDISVLSFDNLDISELLSPALSTFQEDSDNIARGTANLILRVLSGEKDISTELIPPILFKRDSVIKI
jgi:DNA-binding LacI/PurR family transcriptional regulator